MTAILSVHVALLVAGTTLFGWNLAELNAPQKAIQGDLHLNAAQFGLASSILAIGGLLGSIITTPGMNALGRKKILVIAAMFFTIGGILKAAAGGPVALTAGRFLSGIGAGSAAVVVPIYINELAPPSSRGAFGSLTQISINFGILSSQVMGIFLEEEGQWRLILLVGAVVGCVQGVGLLFLAESPASLAASGNLEQARRELIKIRGTTDVEEELAGYQIPQAAGICLFSKDTNVEWLGNTEGTETERADGVEPLIAAEAGQSAGTEDTQAVDENTPLVEDGTTTNPASNQIGLLEFVTKRQFRLGFMIVAGLMLAQQLTGINAVVFYGVSILEDLFPNSAKYLNAAISAVNLLVTLGASFLFDTMSHTTLLLRSILMMACSSALLAVGIWFKLATLSAISTLSFVSGFSMGLGPLPWMVASQRIEPNGVGAAQSSALIANWIGTFVVSFAVPVIAHAAGMHAVFISFAILGAAFYWWGFYYL
ncbi:unnamed protein product [Tuber aestivum]|uniref:Major facilitator superfamily (MFS) profile domain-containing protein n=1 Tax=Tuber aestivum TaxID=59557 RepID=A0A292Q8I0_9PEZI|nr:unnamed protein product [Tuber aestivum]